MNIIRQKLIETLFLKLDTQRNEKIEISVLKKNFHSTNHPDVKSGKKSEQFIQCEFEETLESYCNLYGIQLDKEITKQKFIDYYNYVSATIEEDKEFEEIITSIWNLNGDQPRDLSQIKEEKKKTVNVYKKAPFDTSNEPTDYKTLKEYPLEQKTRLFVEQEEEENDERNLLKIFKQSLRTMNARGIFGLLRAIKVK